MDNRTVYYQASEPKPAVLIIFERGRGIRTVSLDGDMDMGRMADGINNDISLFSGIVSKHHGRFVYADDCYYYTDTNSLNGTFYNGIKLEKINERGTQAVRLNDGDVLRIDRKQLDRPHPEAVEMIFSTSLSPDEKWHCFRFNKPTATIGRDSSCDIMLSDFMVSNHHATLANDGRGWEIIDNRSRNGIAVNKNPVNSRQRLNPFDVIRIADTTLILLGDSVIYNDARDIQDRSFHYNNRSVIMNVNINEVKVKKRRSISQKKTLLRNINLDIEAGDFILILGGSGAGKTTFINSLLGTIHADGRILIGGMDLYSNFRMMKHKIGLVPQFPTTRDNDTVYHTILDSAKIRLAGEYSTGEIKQRVESVIEKMMLTSLRDSFIKNLSGGQKKRVEVAIQAVGDQKIFILDEPDSGMDFASRVDLMGNLKECTDTGSVVAVISHSPDDASDMFTKVIVLAKSKTDEVGHLAYYGDVKNALSFFGVEKLSSIVMEINYEGGKGRADEFIRKFEMTRSGLS